VANSRGSGILPLEFSRLATNVAEFTWQRHPAAGIQPPLRRTWRDSRGSGILPLEFSRPCDERG
jgi:hypothetical protein